MRVYSVYTFSPIFITVCHFYFRHLHQWRWYVIVSLICISLKTTNDSEHLFTKLLFVYHLWRNTFLSHFLHFRIEILSLHYRFVKLHYIFRICLYQIYDFKIFSPVLVLFSISFISTLNFISLLLLALNLVCSSFSDFFRWKAG